MSPNYDKLPNKKKNKTTKTKVTETRVTVKNNKAEQRVVPYKQKSKALVKGGNSKNEFLRSYINSMVDPMCYSPPLLGFGTFDQPPQDVAWIRKQFIVNTDGTFSIFIMPFQAAILNVNISGAAGATWVNYAATNSTTLGSTYSQARVVSGGYRLVPMVAASASPGAIFCGTMAGFTPNAANTYTNDLLVSQANARLGLGLNGSQDILRPTDPHAYEFSADIIATSYSGSAILPGWRVPFVAGAGFATGTVMYVEVVLNFECVNKISQNGGLFNKTEPTLADYFPSIEELQSKIRNYIPTTATMSFNDAANLAIKYGPKLMDAYSRHRPFQAINDEFKENPRPPPLPPRGARVPGFLDSDGHGYITQQTDMGLLWSRLVGVDSNEYGKIWRVPHGGENRPDSVGLVSVEFERIHDGSQYFMGSADAPTAFNPGTDDKTRYSEDHANFQPTIPVPHGDDMLVSEDEDQAINSLKLQLARLVLAKGKKEEWQNITPQNNNNNNKN